MVILNFANCDMVGHTGVFDAAVKAVETVDTCAGRVAQAVREMEGVLLITADHGNADKMYEPDGSPFTAHTTNLVPFCVVGYQMCIRDSTNTLLWPYSPRSMAETVRTLLSLPKMARVMRTSAIPMP